MTIICRDLMVGNPRLAELGYVEESMGHNAIGAMSSYNNAIGQIIYRTATLWKQY